MLSLLQNHHRFLECLLRQKEKTKTQLIIHISLSVLSLKRFYSNKSYSLCFICTDHLPDQTNGKLPSVYDLHSMED